MTLLFLFISNLQFNKINNANYINLGFQIHDSSLKLGVRFVFYRRDSRGDAEVTENEYMTLLFLFISNPQLNKINNTDYINLGFQIHDSSLKLRCTLPFLPQRSKRSRRGNRE